MSRVCSVFVPVHYNPISAKAYYYIYSKMVQYPIRNAHTRTVYTYMTFRNPIKCRVITVRNVINKFLPCILPVRFTSVKVQKKKKKRMAIDEIVPSSLINENHRRTTGRPYYELLSWWNHSKSTVTAGNGKSLAIIIIPV